MAFVPACAPPGTMNEVWNEPSEATMVPRFTGVAPKSISTTPQETQKPLPESETMVPPGPWLDGHQLWRGRGNGHHRECTESAGKARGQIFESRSNHGPHDDSCNGGDLVGVTP